MDLILWRHAEALEMRGDLLSLLGEQAKAADAAGRPALHTEQARLLKRVAQLWIDKFGNHNQAVKPLEELYALDPADADTVTRLRDYAQARQPRLEVLDLADVVQESLALLDWEVQRDGVRVNIHRPVDTFELMADRLMLQQLFVNLMRNAIEAMRMGGDATRCLDLAFVRSRSGREVELSLKDNGCGLPPDAEARLFEPFQSSKPNGMGMGLNICRSFVELHQGRLWFTRNSDLQANAAGVTFHVLLPLHTGANT